MVWQIAFGIFLGRVMFNLFAAFMEWCDIKKKELEAKHPELKESKTKKTKGPIGFKMNEERC